MRSPLAGKLFDESGEGLTPSHAVKGQRRYRYYLSRRLINGTANEARTGWRLPAAEIERSIATAAAMVLDDRGAILADNEQSGSDTNQIKSILDSTSAWSSRLRSEAEEAHALELLVSRVELRPDGIRLSVSLPMAPFEKLAGRGPAHLNLTRLVPIQMRRRGIETKFIISGNLKASQRTDPALLKVISRAHCWLDDLVSGRAA